ncbi:unnamed protein product [Amoebophrya sp. A25]|nr:unnamed protein product [Amoebophrya sp. A25]|eukprot:GSA25T00000899001.1
MLAASALCSSSRRATFCLCRLGPSMHSEDLLSGRISSARRAFSWNAAAPDVSAPDYLAKTSGSQATATAEQPQSSRVTGKVTQVFKKSGYLASFTHSSMDIPFRMSDCVDNRVQIGDEVQFETANREGKNGVKHLAALRITGGTGIPLGQFSSVARTDVTSQTLETMRSELEEIKMRLQQLEQK